MKDPHIYRFSSYLRAFPFELVVASSHAPAAFQLAGCYSPAPRLLKFAISSLLSISISTQ